MVILISFWGCRMNGGDDSYSDVTGETETAEETFDAERISSFRWGLSRVFVQSETGIYCVRQEEHNGAAERFILYCDMNSDTFMKICGRPDCTHCDHTCNAWLPGGSMGLSYYNGHLYFMDPAPELSDMETDHSSAIPAERRAYTLYQMDRNGENRKAVAALFDKDELASITGHSGELYSNGYLHVTIHYKEEGSEPVSVQKFTSLETGEYLQEVRMQEMPEGDFQIFAGTADGSILLLYSGSGETGEGEGSYNTLYRWDPETNVSAFMARVPSSFMSYFGEEYAYDIRDGIIYRWSYQKEQEEAVFDTGFAQGTALRVFPDCYVVTDYLSAPSDTENIVTARFYDTNYVYQGSCCIPCQAGPYTRNVFFGETEDRILFCDDYLIQGSFWQAPAYYIEKSDFGTGQITLHEYHFPEEGK